MKKILLVLFISFPLYALELGEGVEVSLEKVLPENVIVLSKGKADHVRGMDQIKIMSEGEFVSRAICVGVGKLRAAWKIFRVVKPQAFRIGKKFSVLSVSQQDTPWEYIDKPLQHYRQIVIDFYPSGDYPSVNEGDFTKVKSKIFFKSDE